MPRPLTTVHNAETNEIIEREMTKEEFDTYKAIQAENAAFAQSMAEAEARKAAVLAKLGISEEDARSLLS